MSAKSPEQKTHRAAMRACSQALAKYGYKKMTMDDVARMAGLHRRTLYLHFPDKKALVRASVEAIAQLTRDAMRRELEASRDGIECVRRVLIARVQARLDSTSEFVDTIEDVLENLYLQEGVSADEFFRHEQALVAQALQFAIDDRSLPPMPVSETADLLLRATNTFMPASLSPEERKDTKAAMRKLAQLTGLLVRGLEFTHPGEAFSSQST